MRRRLTSRSTLFVMVTVALVGRGTVLCLRARYYCFRDDEATNQTTTKNPLIKGRWRSWSASSMRRMLRLRLPLRLSRRTCRSMSATGCWRHVPGRTVPDACYPLLVGDFVANLALWDMRQCGGCVGCSAGGARWLSRVRLEERAEQRAVVSSTSHVGDYCAGGEYSYHYDSDHHVDKRLFARFGLPLPRIREICRHVVRPACEH